MWAWARYDLGIPTEEWGTLTPRLLAKISERRDQDLYRADLRFGILDSIVVNAVQGKRGKRAKPEDFVMSGPKKKRKAQGSTPRQMLAFAEMWTKAAGGKDLRAQAQNVKAD